jgi:hypothetical protein
MVKVLCVFAIAIGVFFSYVDHRPNFDDMPILVLAIALATFVFGAIEPRYPWLWALLIGGIIPLVNIATGGGFPSLLVLVFSFAGAYLGSFSRRMLIRST